VVAALAARGASVPTVAVNDYLLPAWVGPVDTVVAISCSGETEETLAAAAEAVRRGSRLVAIGAAGSSLHQLAATASGSVLLSVDAQGRMPRASLWTLLTPTLIVAESLGLVSGVEPALRHAADRLDEVSLRCGVDIPLEENEAKTLGLALAEALPLLWGSGEVGAVAAARLACQLNENAKLPAVLGVLPEAQHNQVVTLDGVASGAADLYDIFRDRVADPDPDRSLRMVLVRDSEEGERAALRADLSATLADERGIPVSMIRSGEGHPVARLADLIGVIDWASVYAALALGVDPSPIGPIDELKARMARAAESGVRA
jgi:glucose/mannose-6-phosphate isomerase